MNINNDETLQVYIDESIEHLADIESDLLRIEERGADIDEDLVNKVYRAAHSIKGGAGFMGLSNIKNLTHRMENVLGKIRSREMIPNAEIINILLLAADSLRNLINDADNSNDIDVSDHINALNSLTQSESKEKEKFSGCDCVDASFIEGGFAFKIPGDTVTRVKKEGKYVYLVQIDLMHDLLVKGRMLQDLFDEIQDCGVVLDSKIDLTAAGLLQDEDIIESLPFLILFASILKPDDINVLFDIEEEHIFELDENLTTRCLGGQTPKSYDSSEAVVYESDNLQANDEEASPRENQEETEAISIAAATQNTNVKESHQLMKSVAGETSLRVNVSLLDSLMNLAGELVLGRNQLMQATALNDFHTIQAAGQRLDLITSELQEAIMLTRMQPIGNVFNKFPRVVRDLAINLGKKVDLILEGKDVELDKTIIEAISDPLTHLVRNAVDHGIEFPAVRRKAGKSAVGKLFLKAYHEAGQVNIEIFDDGKGLDGKVLAGSAVAKGLVTEDQVRMMSDKEKVNLILLPGFSTAERITDVSGRGVGMDVVKTNLDRLGGQIDIDSQPGMGTTFRIKLPLTLAIIPCQIIFTGCERYAIPQINLEELLRIPADQVKNRIERVGDAEVVRLRGNLLPLIRLADVIGLERTYLDSEEKILKKDRRERIADRRSPDSPAFSDYSHKELPVFSGSEPENEFKHERREVPDRRYHAKSALNIVVVSTGALSYGLVVDELHDSEEIVVKPLGRHLKHCKGYAGATIMGDGRVALILDLGNLARMADLTSVEGTDRASEVAREAADSSRIDKDKQSLLVFRSSEEEQFAVFLNQVERIEKIKATEIEYVGGKRVMQYRGGSLPLFSIDEVAKVEALAEKEDVLVIVSILKGKEVGLLAIGPVDAVEILIDIDSSTLKQPGIMGSAVISGKTTLLVDMFDIVKILNPTWFLEEETVSGFKKEVPTILIAEDSNFFRSQVKGFMEEEGYKVIEAEDGMVAWNLLQEHADEISLLLTDIEMPNLDGIGLAKKVKGDNKHSSLPVIALTTLAGEEDINKGIEVGVDDYQIKLDRGKLIESVKARLP